MPESTDSRPADVIIDLQTGSPYTVSDDSFPSIRNLTIDSTDAIVRWESFSKRPAGVSGVIDLLDGKIEIDDRTVVDATELRLNGNQLDLLNSFATFEGTALIGDTILQRKSLVFEHGASYSGRMELRNFATISVQGAFNESHTSFPFQISLMRS